MKKPIIYFLIPFLVVLICSYLVTAFVEIEVNPAKWERLTRQILAFWGLIVSLFAGALSVGISLDSNKF